MHHNNKYLDLISEYVNGILYLERFVDINGYEGRYQISNFGRVKSVYIGYLSNKEDKILSQNNDKDGYLNITFLYNKKRKTFKVHRLVAIHFIDNPNKLQEVNHKMFIKKDNRFHQLEWCTAKQNTVHSFKNSQRTIYMKGRCGDLHHASKGVYCTTLGIEFNSVSEAENKLGTRCVSDVCNGNRLHAKGLHFRYVN